MADEIRDLGIFAAAGILVAVLIIGGFVAGGIHFPSLRLPSMISDKGRLIIQIMDKPVNLTHLNITIDSLSIQDGEGNWTDLQLLGGEPIYFDLLALENVTMTLSDTKIPAGNYTMLKMHVLTANATKTNGEIIDPLNIPSSDIRVLLKPHLEMESESSITVTIDLEPDPKIAISHSLNLKPVLKAMVG